MTAELPIPLMSPHVSVNRVRIVELPGVPLDPGVRGRRAYELFSSQAVIEYAREQAAALALPPQHMQDTLATRLELPPLVSESLASADPARRAAAESIGRRLGRNLGAILLTLHRGDDANQAVRPDWTPEDWRQWAAVGRVWLGGGIASGALGELMVREARAMLAEANAAESVELRLTPHRQAMTLLGAARYLPAGTRSALVLDCGQTLVKRGAVRLEGGAIRELVQFAPWPVDWSQLGAPHHTAPENGRRVLEWVSHAIAETVHECRAAGIEPDEDLMLCVAAYVRGGELLGNGVYAQMSAVRNDVRPLLADTVAELAGGRRLDIHPIHDGTAAAAMHAGERDARVIVMGTALGVGAPPETAEHLRPISLTERP